MTSLPPSAYREGRPLPADRFADVGKCHSTGREITICYNTFGDPSDPCLLMAMGLGGTLLAFSDDLCTLLAAKGFYVVRFDNRDVGLSTHLDGAPTAGIVRMGLPSCLSIGEGEPSYSLDDMARDAFGLLDQLGISSAHVLGCSMGGMIVQCMAIQAPERVRSLIILFSHSSGPKVISQTWGLTFSFLSKPRSDSKEDQIAFRAERYQRFSGDYYKTPANYSEYTAQVMERAPNDMDGVMRQMWATRRAASRDDGLKALEACIPTLIIHGMKDEMIPYMNGVHLAKMIKNAKLVLYPHMGHALPPELHEALAGEIALMKSSSKEEAPSATRSEY